MELIFATHNSNKVVEVSQMLPDGVKFKSLSEISWNDEIPETSDTIEGNALLKAKAVHQRLGVSVVAEDTGLEVAALGGAPGVYTARYAGPDCNMENNIRLLLQNLSGSSDRSAQFKTVVAYIDENGRQQLFEGICEGFIQTAKTGNGGFGYDPVFNPKGYSVSFAEMSSELKNQISHRAKAMKQFLNYINHHILA